jgi:uroporphyrinogen-III decarboxylase
MIGDTLRGTKGIMLDIYRQPEKLLEAMEAITPLMIKMGIGAAQATGQPIIFIPLHKGADGFMSDEHFEKFYWPSLRNVILGLIEAGCVPNPAAEGGYNSRLDVVKDLPKGKTLWMIDQSDMVKVKQSLGQNACLMGNVPSSMLSLGKPEEVKDYAKKLIETVGKGGGFILSNGSFFDQAKPENVKAMVEAAKEYGAYN